MLLGIKLCVWGKYNKYQQVVYLGMFHDVSKPGLDWFCLVPSHTRTTYSLYAMIQDLQTQLQMLLSRHTYFQRINRQLRPRLLGEVEDIQRFQRIHPPTRVDCQEPRSFWKHQKIQQWGGQDDLNLSEICNLAASRIIRIIIQVCG